MESLEEWAKSLAGNHRRFESFAWFDRPEDADNWGIYYTHNRDSSALDRSNAEVIAQALEPFTEGDNPDAVEEDHGHWACGWIKGYRIRVYRDGAITPAARVLYGLCERMDDYPVLDEEAWSDLEWKDAEDAGCMGCYRKPEDRPRWFIASDDGEPVGWHAACARLAACKGDRDAQRALSEYYANSGVGVHRAS